MLEQLRRVSAKADPALAAELVTHLTVRNDHFRKAASIGGADLIGGMSDVLSNEDSARVLMGIAGDQPTEMFEAELSRLWEQYGPMLGLTGMTQAQFNDFAFQGMKANFSTFHAEMVGPLRDAFGGIIEKIPDAAADAQRRALAENLTPARRVDRLAEFQWQTVETKPLVLPDCVAVGADPDNDILPLMLAELDKTQTIFMPLGTNRMLIGSLSDAPEVPQDINKVFASCSWDFFVARDRTPELEGYCSLLRETSKNFMSGTINEVIEDTLCKSRS